MTRADVRAKARAELAYREHYRACLVCRPGRNGLCETGVALLAVCGRDCTNAPGLPGRPSTGKYRDRRAGGAS